jgi:hypothetical protein
VTATETVELITFVNIVAITIVFFLGQWDGRMQQRSRDRGKFLDALPTAPPGSRYEPDWRAISPLIAKGLIDSTARLIGRELTGTETFFLLDDYRIASAENIAGAATSAISKAYERSPEGIAADEHSKKVARDCDATAARCLEAIRNLGKRRGGESNPPIGRRPDPPPAPPPVPVDRTNS